MTRYALLVSTLLAGSGLAGTALADAPKVVASIKPVHSLVSAVMEGVGEPELIVKGAGSPHTYSMKPSEAAAVGGAEIVFWVGGELEPFLRKPVETLGERATVIELSKAHDLVTLSYRDDGPFETHEHDVEGSGGHDHDHAAADDHDHGEGHDHEEAEETPEHDHDHAHGSDEGGHDHHQAGAIDMHLWLDPANARVWVHEIAEALVAADPDNAQRYEANAEALTGRLTELEEEIAAEIEPVKGRPFVVFHDAYQYFENRFDIRAAGSITVSPEVAPGAQRVSEMRDKIRKLGAACVFAEPQFEPRIVRTVIEGTEAKAGVLDPSGADLTDGPDLYFELMRGLTSSLSSCLSESS
ncbi:MAG: zinc ABC transporter substrate-binding protein [Rhizobiaceae bacterium]|nr:zinc ABC transporter substrate-binding protein [Rhizobiaceae bacterium]MCV0407372.1 zinc ABC transporter substrate-binding protein [Rhizobiaceae bacterium]